MLHLYRNETKAHKVDLMQKDLRNVNSGTLLTLSTDELEKSGSLHTASEISQQPDLWKKTYQLVRENKTEVKSFLSRVFEQPGVQVILTGAGSSSFIGGILEGPFTIHTGHTARAVATTDLLTHPDYYIANKKPVLLVSFARSGNSPESMAVVSLLNSICENVFHLIITCNAEGKLAKGTVNEEKYLVLLLPAETDDKSLVMTSSFTCMLLAGLLISRIDEIEELRTQVNTLAEYGSRIINGFTSKLKEVSLLDFDRVIFLGSGPLLGAAEESQLKVQEMTDGKVVGKFDSYLGFRHGPKAVINSSTLIIYLLSNEEYAFNYEADLVRDVNAKAKKLYSIGVIESGGANLNTDLLLQLTDSTGSVDEEFKAVCDVLPAQILGFFCSRKLGLKPDNPSQSGAITRIVQGVNIYPFERS